MKNIDPDIPILKSFGDEYKMRKKNREGRYTNLELRLRGNNALELFRCSSFSSHLPSLNSEL